MVSDWEWDPDTYLQTMAEEIPGYAELEDAVVEATRGLDVRDALELGVGTGETALRVLAAHPGARWTGIDASEAMLAVLPSLLSYRSRERAKRGSLVYSRSTEVVMPGRGPWRTVQSRGGD